MKLFFAAAFFACLCLPKLAVSQHRLGVDWHAPLQPSEVEQDLATFSKAGISYLQIHQKLSAKTWSQIDSLGFSVWGMLPLEFPISSSFSKKDSSRLSNLRGFARYYQKHKSVKAIGIFAFANENGRTLKKRIHQFAASVRKLTSKPLYYISANAGQGLIDPLFSFKMFQFGDFSNSLPGQAGGVLYHPYDHKNWSVSRLKRVLQTASQTHDTPVFFSSVWLKKMLKNYGKLSKSLRIYSQTNEMAFALPEPSHHINSYGSLVSVLLLLLWILLGFTYRQNPLYRKSFSRYFGGHSFYVDDVLHGHIRNLGMGVSILLQHLISGMIVGYCLFKTLFSSLSIQALFAYYPVLSIFGHGAAAILLWLFLGVLLMQVLAVAWLWLAGAKMLGFKQLLNLYPWVLQINIITATLAAYFYLSGAHFYFIGVMAALFVLIFAGAFIISGMDIARYLRKKKWQYLSSTIGLFMLIWGGFILWITLSSKLPAVINLALYLS